MTPPGTPTRSAHEPLSTQEATEPASDRDTARCLRDVVALSTLPTLWLGAAPARIVESLAASLFTILGADFIYVRLEGDDDHGPLSVAQTSRTDFRTDVPPELGAKLGDWARTRDPDELLRLADPGGQGILRVTARPLGLNAEYGILAAGFFAALAPNANHQLLLGVAATQATHAIDNLRLLRSIRRQAAQLRGLADTTGTLLDPSLSVTQALQVLTDRARELIGAHQAVTSMTVDQNWAQAINATSLSDKYAAYRSYATKPDGTGIYSVVCREQRVMRMTQRELEQHPAWRGFGKEAGAHPPMRGWLAAPLTARDGSNLGLMQLSDKLYGEFTESDAAILVQLASLAALVLEQRMAEDARQAARREAEAARAEAESASRMKDEFLAMLGHELRNPLAPIHTALQIMQLRDPGAAERERTVIERQVRHLTRLVDDLLDVSRIARGKVDLKRERLDLSHIVARALEIASPLLEQRRHTLELNVARDGLVVDGDAMRLAQVVANLLTNAAKYTPSGGTVTVRGERSGDEVVLRVRDTGIGIAPEMLPRVFELFVQGGGQGLDRSQGGLGLGLTIVRSLMAMHGGSVSVTSEGANRGSEFVLRFPAATPVAAEPSTTPAADSSAGAHTLRVLVVDDNEDAADMLANALSATGHTVRVAHDGPAALRVAAEFLPQIALLDIGLPVMDGYELAGRLRGRPEHAGIRLIALTGYGQEADRRRALAAGFARHIVKPVDLEALEAAMRGE